MNNQFVIYAMFHAFSIAAGASFVYCAMKPKKESPLWYLIGSLTFLVLIAAVVSYFPEQCDYKPQGWDVIQRICWIIMASGAALLFVIGLIVSIYRWRHLKQDAGVLEVHVVKVPVPGNDAPENAGTGAGNGSPVGDASPNSTNQNT